MLPKKNSEHERIKIFEFFKKKIICKLFDSVFKEDMKYVINTNKLDRRYSESLNEICYPQRYIGKYPTYSGAQSIDPDPTCFRPNSKIMYIMPDARLSSRDFIPKNMRDLQQQIRKYVPKEKLKVDFSFEYAPFFKLYYFLTVNINEDSAPKMSYKEPDIKYLKTDILYLESFYKLIKECVTGLSDSIKKFNERFEPEYCENLTNKIFLNIIQLSFENLLQHESTSESYFSSENNGKTDTKSSSSADIYSFFTIIRECYTKAKKNAKTDTKFSKSIKDKNSSDHERIKIFGFFKKKIIFDLFDSVFRKDMRYVINTNKLDKSYSIDEIFNTKRYDFIPKKMRDLQQQIRKYVPKEKLKVDFSFEYAPFFKLYYFLSVNINKHSASKMLYEEPDIKYLKTDILYLESFYKLIKECVTGLSDSIKKFNERFELEDCENVTNKIFLNIIQLSFENLLQHESTSESYFSSENNGKTDTKSSSSADIYSFFTIIRECYTKAKKNAIEAFYAKTKNDAKTDTKFSNITGPKIFDECIIFFKKLTFVCLKNRDGVCKKISINDKNNKGKLMKLYLPEGELSKKEIYLFGGEVGGRYATIERIKDKVKNHTFKYSLFNTLSTKKVEMVKRSPQSGSEVTTEKSIDSSVDENRDDTTKKRTKI